MAEKDAIESLDKLIEKLIPKAIEAVTRTAKKVEAKLLRQHMAGPTSDSSLSKRTGALGRTIKAEPATAQGTTVTSKITAGVNYAKVHFGPLGSTVKIVPIKAKMLAIPLAAAKTAAGVARGGPRAGIWGPTKCFRSKAGNLIIWGYEKNSARKAQGNLTPLFVLKDSVVIKRRIDPKVDLSDWAKPILTQELKNAGILKP